MSLILQIINLSFKSLRSNKLRSFLSMLGIVIGVFTIILVVAIGNTVSKAIDDQFRFLNVTTIVAQPVNPTNGKSKLNERDIKFIMQRSSLVSVGTEVFFGRASVSYSGIKKQYNVLAGNENFMIALPLGIGYGRFFSKNEAINGARVVVIGKVVADEIFGAGSNPVGKDILVSGKIFKVIGTMVPSGGIGPFSFDDSVIMPISASNKFLSNATDPKPMIFLAKDVNKVQDALSELKTILRKLHSIKAGADDDFALRDQGTILVLARAVASITKYLLVGVGAIVLVVSGIGIMNVMFAGVAERKKEIGILRSIGARKKDVLLQFLVESLILALIGSLVGGFLGISLIYSFNLISPYKVLNSISGVIIAIFFALFTGVFFGLYPAKRASDLDPVDSLR